MPEAASAAFWTALLAILPIYGWAAFEALSLARTLQLRARLGLADPVVMHRMAQWGVSGVVVVGMTALSRRGSAPYAARVSAAVAMLRFGRESLELDDLAERVERLEGRIVAEQDGGAE